MWLVEVWVMGCAGEMSFVFFFLMGLGRLVLVAAGARRVSVGELGRRGVCRMMRLRADRWFLLLWGRAWDAAVICLACGRVS